MDRRNATGDGMKAQGESRGTLVVVGTGIQGGGQSTLAARRTIERADRVLFGMVDAWTVAWIRSLNPKAESLAYPMDDSPRRRTYAAVVERTLDELRKGYRVCLVFYGHPGIMTTPGHVAIARARREGFHARMIPGVSALDCLSCDLGLDPGADGCHVYEATDFLIRSRAWDVHTPLVLFQVGLIGNSSFFDADDTASIRRSLGILERRSV